jgi:hypothetical protein
MLTPPKLPLRLIERTTECPTAVVKANTTWRAFPTLWRTLLDEVWVFLGATPGLRTEGHNIMLYRNDVPDVEIARAGPALGSARVTFQNAIPTTPITTASTTISATAYPIVGPTKRGFKSRVLGQ